MKLRTAGNQVHLEGALTVEFAAELHAALLALLGHAHASILVDVSGVTQLDTAGAQVLLSVQRTAETLLIQNWPDECRGFLQNLGLWSHFR